MFKILDNIYIWVFLVNIESVLLLALARYMLCSHFTQNCILLFFLEAKNPYCWKSSYICVFILSKRRRNWFDKNPTQERLVVESCPNPRWMAFLMLYRLVYNISSHFNELILAWSVYIQWEMKKFLCNFQGSNGVFFELSEIDQQSFFYKKKSVRVLLT